MVAAIGASPADAGVIAQDHYVVGPGNYTVGGLNGQSSSAAIGFSGAWAVSSANLQADTLSLGGADGSGKGKFIASTAFSDFSRTARHNLANTPLADPPNNTFYMSHHVFAGPLAIGGADEADAYAMVGFGSFTDDARLRSNANYLLGAFTGFVPSATVPGGVDLVLRSRTGVNSTSDVLLVANAENVTYQVVLALEYNNPGDTLRYWVDPTDFDNGEAGLTATAAVSGSIAGFQLGAASDMSQLTVATWGFDHSFFWDRSTLADDVASVPEPASAALLGLGALAVFSRKR
jgi:hypothetical protein